MGFGVEGLGFRVSNVGDDYLVSCIAEDSWDLLISIPSLGLLRFRFAVGLGVFSGLVVQCLGVSWVSAAGGL